jgi:malonate transporter and related proteins
MAEVTGLVLPFFGLILLGYITARIVRQPQEALGWFNTFIIYLALPALFIKLLSQTPVEELARWDFVLTNVAATFAIFASIFAIGVFLRRSGIADATIQGFAGSYGNIGYMCPGLAILAFGERAAVPVALIMCFETIMHFTLAPTLMAIAGGTGQKAHEVLLDVARRVIFHPFIIATAIGVGIAFLQFAPPAPVQRLIDYLAQAAAPCALFVMGVTLALRPLKRRPVELSYIVPFKLLAHPLLMYVALSWIGDFPPAWVLTAVLMAALPTATNVFVIGQQYGVWVERASATILITTVLSVLTLSLLLYGITSGMLPPDLFPDV